MSDTICSGIPSTCPHCLRASLERVTAENLEQARLLGMGSEREAKLMAEVQRVTEARDAAQGELADHLTLTAAIEYSHRDAERRAATLRDALAKVRKYACTCPCHIEGGYCDQCCGPDDLIPDLDAVLADTRAAAEAFVARVKAQERERCAAILDTIECDADGINTPTWGEGVSEGFGNAIRHGQEAIRALSDECGAAGAANSLRTADAAGESETAPGRVEQGAIPSPGREWIEKAAKAEDGMSVSARNPDLFVSTAAARRAGWIAGRDAAARVATRSCGCYHDILALVPPGDAALEAEAP